MSKKLMIGILSIISGIVAFIGIVFMVLALTGSVTFLKNSITVTSESYDKEYDGLGLDKTKYSLNGKLYEGDEIQVEFYDDSYNVGSYVAYFDCKVVNKNGKDVSESYNINKNYGTVNITKRELTLKVNSEEEKYDGKELKTKSYEIVNGKGSLADNDELDVTLLGSITEIGEEKASLLYAIYSNREGKKVNVTSNYKVVCEDGILTKSKIPLTIKSDSSSFEYDGKEHNVETYTTPYLKEDSNDSNPNHTECLNDGDTIKYTAITNEKEVGKYTNEYEISIQDEMGNDVSKYYAISKEYGEITILKKKIIVYSFSKEKEYDDEIYVAQKDSSYDLDGSLASGDTIDISFTQMISTVGTYENEFYLNILDSEGKFVTNNYEVSKVYGKLVINPRPVTFVTQGDSKVYDGTPLVNTNPAEVLDSTPLLQGHYFSTDFNQEITNYGEISNVCSITIKNDNQNDVTRNYDITIEAGTLKIEKRKLTLRASSLSKAYDGNPIESPSWNLISGSMAPDEYLVVEVTPEITLSDVGTTRNIIKYQIVSSEGAILTNTYNNYEITLLDGILSIYEAANKPLYLAPKDVYKIYYDETQTIHAEEYLGFEYYKSLGYQLDCVFEGTQTGLGISTSSIKADSIRIRDDSNVDVTNQFEIHLFTGLLQIYESEIQIETPSIDVTYDGTIHSDDNITITGADGLDIVYTVTGRQMNVGTSVNSISISGVYLQSDTLHTNNIKDHYYINITYGYLKVTQKELQVTTKSSDTKVDGVVSCPLEDSDIVGLINGHTYQQSVVVLDYYGSIQNSITILIFDENGNDVTYNYKINYDYGTLTLS